MKRICLLLTVLFVTVSFTSMVYATDNVFYKLLIPGENAGGLGVADSLYASVHAYNSGKSSYNLLADCRLMKAKMLKWSVIVVDTSASSDSAEIIYKVSFDDTTDWVRYDTLEVIPKTPGSMNSWWTTVQSDSVAEYARVYVKQWGLTGTAVSVTYLARIDFYDADGVWVGKRQWKTNVIQKAGY